MSIGFYRGVTLLDVSKGANLSDKKYLTSSTSGFCFGFPLVNQFRAEVGLSMSNILMNTNSYQKPAALVTKNNIISVPVTLQYFLLPKKSKIQPYFGIGAMIVPDAPKYMMMNGDGVNLIQGTGNVNLLITQGVNVEINTKIHLTESLHIINSEGKTNFGLNFGVSFYVP